MKQAAVGFCVHSGWSAVVALSMTERSPVVEIRERVQLVDEFTFRLRQPYHTAENMPLVEAREFIDKVRKTAGHLAHRSIRSLQERLHEHGCELNRGTLLLASGKRLPELEAVLESHALIHTADGELFREAIREAGSHCGLRLLRVREKELLKRASQQSGRSEAVLLQQAKELGRPFGSPWSRDEKFATLAAWLALLDVPLAEHAS